MFDAIIVGGGVVGCAVLRELTQRGFSCVLLEKEQHLISGASKGNSAMAVQSAFESDASLELRCLNQAVLLNKHFFALNNLPITRCGSLMLAWKKHELDSLPRLMQRAIDRGVSDVALLSPAEVLQLEPHVNPSVLGGFLIKGESVVDSWLMPVYMAHQAIHAGAKVICDCKVIQGVQESGGSWEIETSKGRFRGRMVINAAGLFGDEVESISSPSDFKIKPRMGQYVVFEKSAKKFINHILLPVPSETSKGVIVFPSVHGNVVVGPTAEEVEERSDPVTSDSTLNQLRDHAYFVIPALRQFTPIGAYAGLRPATQYKDYQIYANPGRNWVTIGGIRSTGVSACLGIASYVHSLVRDALQMNPSGEERDLPTLTFTSVMDEEGDILVEGVPCHVTHPLSKFGMTSEEHPKSKL